MLSGRPELGSRGDVGCCQVDPVMSSGRPELGRRRV